MTLIDGDGITNSIGFSTDEDWENQSKGFWKKLHLSNGDSVFVGDTIKSAVQHAATFVLLAAQRRAMMSPDVTQHETSRVRWSHWVGC
mmetsp:Transcript_29749/g.54001  ORF Transcript_29749/g.54001 Transcript_29749/m.54001 type:complete len:88 (+) Transcript_29749:550-813(+)